MNKVQLHIGFILSGSVAVATWHNVDLDSESNITVKMAIDSIQDPVLRRNNSSNSFSIPMTNYNAQIFAHIDRYDSRVYYSPIFKNRFRLYVDGALFQTGYFKIDTVTDKYNITLFGAIGEILNRLNVVDDTDPAKDFRIRNLFFGAPNDPYEHIVNKDVLAAYLSDSPKTGVSYYDHASKANITTPILRYALSYQGEYPNFDSGQMADDTSIEPVTWWDSDTSQFTEANSLTEHQRAPKPNSTVERGEFRSYYQRPAFNMRHILNAIFDRITSLGYSVDLDPNFFNDTNPYWATLWGILPQYSTEIGDNDPPYVFPDSGSTVPPDTANRESRLPSMTLPNYVITASGIEYVGGTINIRVPFRIQKQVLTPIVIDSFSHAQMRITCTANVIYTDGTGAAFQLSPIESTPSYGDGATIVINSSNTLRQRFPLLPLIPTDPYVCEVKRIGEGSSDDLLGGSVYRFGVDILGSQIESTKTIDRIEISMRFNGSTWMEPGDSLSKSVLNVVVEPGVSIITSGGKSITRSNSSVNWGGSGYYNRMFNLETTCMEFLIAYIKLFGLYMDFDHSTGTFSIIKRSTWYGNRDTLDITHRIDYGQKISQEICPFNYRYGILKYMESETPKLDAYKKKFGIDYGAFKFDIGTEFTNEYEDIFESVFQNSILVRGYDFRYLNRYSTVTQHNKYADDKVLLETPKDQEGIILAFYNGTWPTSILVTDDTLFMGINGAYCWLNVDGTGHSDVTDYYTEVTDYPLFTRSINYAGNNYSLNFGFPAEQYNDLIAEYPDTTIYPSFWSAFINDRFNKNTKVLTVRTNLSVDEVKDIFHKFIFIENSVWVVIGCDYNAGNEFTTLKLISVTNVTAYTM